MKVTVVPVLGALRAIYNVEGVMPRFEAYLSFMTRGEEILPLGAFSPMGRQQPDYLDRLLLLQAEDMTQHVANYVATALSTVSDSYRLVLVVVDAPSDKNTWTHRYATDAEWRLLSKYDDIPLQQYPSSHPSRGIQSTKISTGTARWVTVQLWTDQEPTPQYLQQEVRSALYRAAHQSCHGKPKSLHEVLLQEGKALAFAKVPLELEEDDLEYSRQVLELMFESTEYPIWVAALYGDVIAKQLGYPPLGLSPMAGFQVALEDAMFKGYELVGKN